MVYLKKEKKGIFKSTSREAHVCRRLLGPPCGLVLGFWWLCVANLMSLQVYGGTGA